MKAIKEALNIFCNFMVIRINFEKSSLIFSKSVGNKEALENFPIKYLGLPLSTGKLKHVDYRILISSLKKGR